MKHLFLIIIFSGLSVDAAFGQNNNGNCHCPDIQQTNLNTDTIFHLDNGINIALCGFRVPDSKPVKHTEFVLSVCAEDTILGFWGAINTYQLKVINDTLILNQLQNLPTGKNFELQETIWSTEKIYFQSQKTVRTIEVNKEIRKYSQSEIQKVNEAYETAKGGFDDSNIEIVYQLFMAAISGDKKANYYFRECKNKFGTPDGAYAEEYNYLTAMLKQWKIKD